MALYGIAWVINFKFGGSKVDHIDKVVDIAVTSYSCLC